MTSFLHSVPRAFRESPLPEWGDFNGRDDDEEEDENHDNVMAMITVTCMTFLIFTRRMTFMTCEIVFLLEPQSRHTP